MSSKDHKHDTVMDNQNSLQTSTFNNASYISDLPVSKNSAWPTKQQQVDKHRNYIPLSVEDLTAEQQLEYAIRYMLRQAVPHHELKQLRLEELKQLLEMHKSDGDYCPRCGWSVGCDCYD